MKIKSQNIEHCYLKTDTSQLCDWNTIIKPILTATLQQFTTLLLNFKNKCLLSPEQR